MKRGSASRLKVAVLVPILGLIATACGGSSGGDDGPSNRTPVANAGGAQSVDTGDVVMLDGSASSDADGNSLTYSWTLTSVPPDSAAALSNPSAVSPTFTADVQGEYVATLVVNDGTVDSDTATVTVTAAMPDLVWGDDDWDEAEWQ